MIIDAIHEQGFSFNWDKLGGHFAAARDFLLSADLSALAPGRHDVDGDNVFVLMQEYTQQEKAPAYEAHDAYADIQLVLRGSERFLWGHGVPGPLNGDLRVVTEVGDPVEFVLRENQLVIFLPGEAHAPGLPEKGSAFCRKAVVKVKM